MEETVTTETTITETAPPTENSVAEVEAASAAASAEAAQTAANLLIAETTIQAADDAREIREETIASLSNQESELAWLRNNLTSTQSRLEQTETELVSLTNRIAEVMAKLQDLLTPPAPSTEQVVTPEVVAESAVEDAPKEVELKVKLPKKVRLL